MIDPGSAILRHWDVVTFFALLFTMFITPFEVGFQSDACSCPCGVRTDPDRRVLTALSHIGRIHGLLDRPDQLHY